MSAFDNLKNACREGNIRAIYRLKAKGQDLNESDEDGWTGLVFASFHNHLNIAKYLVRRGAIVDAADDYGYTAVMKVT